MFSEKSSCGSPGTAFLEPFWEVSVDLGVTLGGLRGCQNVVETMEISRIPWGTPDPEDMPRGGENLYPGG